MSISCDLAFAELDHALHLVVKFARDRVRQQFQERVGTPAQGSQPLINGICKARCCPSAFDRRGSPVQKLQPMPGAAIRSVRQPSHILYPPSPHTLLDSSRRRVGQSTCLFRHAVRRSFRLARGSVAVRSCRESYSSCSKARRLARGFSNRWPTRRRFCACELGIFRPCHAFVLHVYISLLVGNVLCRNRRWRNAGDRSAMSVDAWA
jgi:hypothetical protein